MADSNDPDPALLEAMCRVLSQPGLPPTAMLMADAVVRELGGDPEDYEEVADGVRLVTTDPDG